MSQQTTLDDIEREESVEDHELLERLYEDEGLTQVEIAERLGASEYAVFKELAHAEITRDFSDIDVPDVEYPWRDEELMRECYLEEKLSTSDIAALLDCSQSTAVSWLDNHGIEKRSQSESMMIQHGTEGHYNLSMDRKGYEVWYVGKHFIWHHRLLALMEYDLDEIKGKEVHHKNGCSWDNRVENLEPMDPGEHSAHHSKGSRLDEIRVAELYEHGEASSYDLGEMFGCSNTMILYIHSKFYND